MKRFPMKRAVTISLTFAVARGADFSFSTVMLLSRWGADAPVSGPTARSA